MFARVSRFQENEVDIADAQERSADVVKKAQAFAGFGGLYYLVDQASGRSLAITLWESEEAMLASEEAASQIRKDEADATDSQILGVDHYQVVTAELR